MLSRHWHSPVHSTNILRGKGHTRTWPYAHDEFPLHVYGILNQPDMTKQGLLQHEVTLSLIKREKAKFTAKLFAGSKFV